jgi:hypothetical protein
MVYAKIYVHRSANTFFLSESAIKESDLEIEAFQKGIDALTRNSPTKGPFSDELSPVKGSDDENCGDVTGEVRTRVRA